MRSLLKWILTVSVTLTVLLQQVYTDAQQTARVFDDGSERVVLTVSGSSWDIEFFDYGAGPAPD